MAEGTHPVKKRKVLDENSSFKKEWEVFFFVERNGKALCFIRHKTAAVMKVCNVKHYFTLVHPKQEEGRVWIISLAEVAAESNTWANYSVAHLVATNLKLFIDGEFFKVCMMASVVKSSEFEAISLSARTLTCHVEEMVDNVQRTLKDMCQSARFFFSIALDESTDIKDMVQLVIFFLGGRDDFITFEDLIRFIPLSSATTGADMCKAVTDWLKEAYLDLSRMCGIMTDGAPAMVRDKKGFAALLVKYLRVWSGVQPTM
ncbi:Hypothetical predicted protein [Octopus vulgaris]|uniref:DUF4371 domain-containing protein n=1 Tax=Octopus vulgaris TaxID=6645 RepID=A0AA36AER4_OCTVU|nr:Hypothetical predicted protein [Octopus vulgaris]